jgi:hypothetical protein
MAIRKEQSSYPESLSLRNALVVKGIIIQPDVNHAYYSGGATERHLLIADMSDGSFRTVVRDGSGTNFDFVDKTDPELVRLWTVRELGIFIGNFPGVSFSDWTKPGAAYIHVIKYNGVDYTGTDSNQANATAEALIAMLNDVPAQAAKK